MQAMFEICVSDDSTIYSIYAPAKFEASHVLWCKNHRSTTFLERVTRWRKSVCTSTNADTSDAVRAPIVVELTEDDIPGAALSEPLESHTVPSLKWWLLCRGTKTLPSWKKQRGRQVLVVTRMLYICLLISSGLMFVVISSLRLCLVKWCIVRQVHLLTASFFKFLNISTSPVLLWNGE